MPGSALLTLPSLTADVAGLVPRAGLHPTAALDPLVRLLAAAMSGLASALPWAAGGTGPALALVLITVTIRIGLLPLALAAFRADRARLALAPELARLRGRHAGDPARLARELSAAHRRAGINPLAGALPLLAQLPVLAAMYRLVTAPVLAGRPNPLLHASLLGARLGAHWPGIVTAAGAGPAPALLLAALLLGLVLLARLSGNQAVARLGPAAGSVRLARLLPYSTAVMAAMMPPAVGLYLLTTTACTVAERGLLARLA